MVEAHASVTSSKRNEELVDVKLRETHRWMILIPLMHSTAGTDDGTVAEALVCPASLATTYRRRTHMHACCLVHATLLLMWPRLETHERLVAKSSDPFLVHLPVSPPMCLSRPYVGRRRSAVATLAPGATTATVRLILAGRRRPAMLCQVASANLPPVSMASLVVS